MSVILSQSHCMCFHPFIFFVLDIGDHWGTSPLLLWAASSQSLAWFSCCSCLSWLLLSLACRFSAASEFYFFFPLFSTLTYSTQKDLDDFCRWIYIYRGIFLHFLLFLIYAHFFFRFISNDKPPPSTNFDNFQNAMLAVFQVGSSFKNEFFSFQSR